MNLKKTCMINTLQYSRTCTCTVHVCVARVLPNIETGLTWLFRAVRGMFLSKVMVGLSTQEIEATAKEQALVGT